MNTFDQRVAYHRELFQRRGLGYLLRSYGLLDSRKDRSMYVRAELLAARQVLQERRCELPGYAESLVDTSPKSRTFAFRVAEWIKVFNRSKKPPRWSSSPGLYDRPDIVDMFLDYVKKTIVSQDDYANPEAVEFDLRSMISGKTTNHDRLKELLEYLIAETGEDSITLRGDFESHMLQRAVSR